MEEAPSATSGGAGGADAAPPPKTTDPASWRLTLLWVSHGRARTCACTARGLTRAMRGTWHVAHRAVMREYLRAHGGRARARA
jgi:hypothetical protein